MLRIIGYARVSSREQSENTHALEQQIARLEAAGASEIFFDIESGSRDNRPQFNCVMQHVHLRQVDEVIFTRLDRMTRSLLMLRKTIEAFKQSGVNLRVLDDAIDLSTAGGKFHINMLGSLAEMEVDRLSERIKHGWQHVKNQKKAINSPFGYRREGDRHVLNHNQYRNTDKTIAEVAREVVETFLQIGTARATQRAMSQKYPGKACRSGGDRHLDFPRSCTGLIDWLESPVLRGHLVYYQKGVASKVAKRDRLVIADTHPNQRLIAEDEFQQISEFLKTSRQTRGWGSNAPKHLFSGLIWCGECGFKCYAAKAYKSPTKITIYYNCKRHSLGQCSQKHCVKERTIEPLIVEALTARAEAIALLADTPSDLSESVELKQLQQQLSGLEQLGFNQAIEEAKQHLRQQIEILIVQQQIYSEQVSGNCELLLEVFQDTDFWSQLSPENRRRVYQKLVNRVVVQDGVVQSVLLKV